MSCNKRHVNRSYREVARGGVSVELGGIPIGLRGSGDVYAGGFRARWIDRGGDGTCSRLVLGEIGSSKQTALGQRCSAEAQVRGCGPCSRAGRQARWIKQTNRPVQNHGTACGMESCEPDVPSTRFVWTKRIGTRTKGLIVKHVKKERKRKVQKLHTCGY